VTTDSIDIFDREAVFLETVHTFGVTALGCLCIYLTILYAFLVLASVCLYMVYLCPNICCLIHPFYAQVLSPLLERFPNLKVVLEHCTTAQGVDFVKKQGPNVAATVMHHTCT